MVASARDVVYIELDEESLMNLAELGFIKVGYDDDKKVIIRLISSEALPEPEDPEVRGVE